MYETWLSNLHKDYKNAPAKFSKDRESVIKKIENGTFIIGPPRQSMVYSQEKLEEMGMVGVYLK